MTHPERDLPSADPSGVPSGVVQGLKPLGHLAAFALTRFEHISGDGLIP